MQTVVSASEMRWCDETTIGTYGISGLLLMENAGCGVARICEREYGPLEGKHVVLLCGKGNNGGDGFVVARHLINSGASISVILLASPVELRGDAKTNFTILEKIRKKTRGALTIRRFSRTVLRKIARPDLIVDALFGTGFGGEVRQPYRDAIAWANSSGARIVAVDVPSGVDGTTGVVVNTAVKADWTVTFGLLKTGLLCNQGRDLAGSIEVVDIGIPDFVRHAPSLKTQAVEGPDVAALLPKRPSTAHKYSVGKVFVLAGSTGYTGAAALCASAALRAGAGAVILGTPQPVYPILARKLTETIVMPLPATERGTIGRAAISEIMERLRWADVAVIGPGLSQNEETVEVLKDIFSRYEGNMVVDADGVTALSAFGFRWMRRRRGSFVLTPHSGEFARLTGASSRDVETNRVEWSRKAAAASRATIVLKGAPTAVAAPDGMVYLNPTGNPGMATVGSGDVLAGLIASLWAQGMGGTQAAFCGVYLHGLAGDLAGARYGERSIVAGDILERLPEAVRTVERMEAR